MGSQVVKMEDNSPKMMIDAVPKYPVFNENIKSNNRKRNKSFDILLDEFTVDDYKSVLFLLMDQISSLENFLSMVKKDKCSIKNEILKMRLSEKTVIELLGTMKRYQDLKSLGTCKHIFLSQEQSFDEISEIWKVLYALCEEVTDNDLKSMIQFIPDNHKDEVLSAEEWFVCALKSRIITKSDLTGLKDIFKDNQECLNIINNFKGSKIKSYYIKTPTVQYPCGYALIFDFEVFRTPRLKRREGSEVDVEALEKLWDAFGFETHVYRDLISPEVMDVLEEFSLKDHTKFDAFVCCFLSHGESSVIFASDGVPIAISKLISTISNKCKSLHEKPKLFFIQACQGSIIFQGVGKLEYDLSDMQESLITSSSLQKSEPIGLDVNAVVSTIDQCVSFRDASRGGLFVQTLCSVMMECGHKDSLLDVISSVTAKVSKIPIDLGSGMPTDAKQIVPAYSTLQKRLILKKKVS